ncbi:MAG: DUF975 family protein [Candidatus Limivicinus sp.]|jgi:uncharacterized membrane protein
MPISRLELKLRAQAVMRSSKPSAIRVGLLYILLTIVMSLLSARILSSNVDYNQILEHIQSGNPEYAMAYLSKYAPSPSAYLIDLALQIIRCIVDVGFVIFLLNSIRNTGACYGNLLDGFGMFGRIILLNLLQGIFIFLWSLLFVVPGIIAAYRYRQAVYILIDHPEKSALDCIRESKRLMNGRKAELFMLDLSFIGWTLASGIAIIGWFVSIWSVPYINMTYALYYEYLAGHIVRQLGNDPFSQFNNPGNSSF